MRIDMIGVPLDFGAGIHGSRLGPERLRQAGLARALEALGHVVTDRGDVLVARDVDEGDPKLRYLEPIVDAATELCERTRVSVAQRRLPLVVGGDHSLALGSIRGAAAGRKLGVIWVDAHADFNTVETSPSGNIHGMPLAALAGLGDARLTAVGRAGSPRQAIAPDNIAMLGVRSVDTGERELLRRHNVGVFGVSDLECSFERVLAKAIAIASRDTDGIYLSVDLDAFDPELAPGVSTPVARGLNVEQGLAICKAVGATGKLVGMDLVELNPTTDVAGATCRLGMALAATALGACRATSWYRSALAG